MKVLFLKTVPGKWRAGEVKEVSAGYALNFLLPQKIAKEVTAVDLKNLEQSKKQQEKKAKNLQKKNKELAQKLKELVLEIKVKPSKKGALFGAVSLDELSGRLRQQGFWVTKDQLSLDYPLKTIGEHFAYVNLSQGQKVKFKIVLKEDNK